MERLASGKWKRNENLSHIFEKWLYTIVQRFPVWFLYISCYFYFSPIFWIQKVIPNPFALCQPASKMLPPAVFQPYEMWPAWRLWHALSLRAFIPARFPIPQTKQNMRSIFPFFHFPLQFGPARSVFTEPFKRFHSSLVWLLIIFGPKHLLEQKFTYSVYFAFRAWYICIRISFHVFVLSALILAPWLVFHADVGLC